MIKEQLLFTVSLEKILILRTCSPSMAAPPSRSFQPEETGFSVPAFRWWLKARAFVLSRVLCRISFCSTAAGLADFLTGVLSDSDSVSWTLTKNNFQDYITKNTAVLQSVNRKCKIRVLCKYSSTTNRQSTFKINFIFPGICCIHYTCC